MSTPLHHRGSRVQTVRVELFGIYLSIPQFISHMTSSILLHSLGSLLIETLFSLLGSTDVLTKKKDFIFSTNDLTKTQTSWY